MTEIDTTVIKKLSKTDPLKAKKLKRLQKKKRLKKVAQQKKNLGESTNIETRAAPDTGYDNIEIDYVTELYIDENDPNYEEFKEVVERFKDKPPEPEDEEDPDSKNRYLSVFGKGNEDSEEEEVTTRKKKGKGNEPVMSKKQRKLLTRPTITELKRACDKPQVVEVWDCTAPNPMLLIQLKAFRNTVQVPKHWSSKRKYMQGKRGIDKPPFKLPEFIEATGIQKIRAAIQQREQYKSLKQKQREKVRPKMGRGDIDYQTLHDAFFKYQTKPKLTLFNDLYFEGKELEVKMREFRPGFISPRLRDALGIGDRDPPPWLFNMQRYGPPPSYPGLRLPGLNAPVPAGAEFGFHAGGWGKPPLDEMGNLLYGNFQSEEQYQAVLESTPWGEVINDIGEEDEAEEEDMTTDELVVDAPTPGVSTPGGAQTYDPTGLASVGGSTSVVSGLNTPDTLDLTKRGVLSGVTSQTSTLPYQVLKPQKAPPQPGALFASQTVYKMPQSMGVASIGGAVTPIGGAVTPIGGAVTPLGGAVTPIGGAVTPLGGAVTPLGGMATPVGGIATPVGGIATPVGGIATPQGGICTPVGGTTTPLGGIATPGGAVSYNPDDQEVNTEFIRKQLKSHEDRAKAANLAAGLVDVNELRRRKAELSGGSESVTSSAVAESVPSVQPRPQKKKKKQFKF